MATEIITVDGDGNTTSGWAAEGGTYTRLQSDDGDTTRLYSPTMNDVRQVSLTDPVDLSGVTINSVSVKAKVRGIDPVSTTYQLGIRTYSTDYWSSNKDTSGDTSYQLVSETWTVNPNTGVAWTDTEIAALQAGIKKINSAAAAITYLYVEIDYTDGGGGGSEEITTYLWERVG